MTVGVANEACVVGTFIAAETCAFWYPLYLAGGLLTCEAAYFLALQTTCHLEVFGSDPGGGPCCPVGCGGRACCDAGETSLGASGLCCGPGFRGCGTGNCCSSTDTCLKLGHRRAVDGGRQRRAAHR